MTDKKKWKDISIYNDYHEGELIFETNDGKGIVERLGDKFTVKLYVTVFQDWETTATWLLAEIREIRNWAWSKAGFLNFKFKLFRDRIYENEKYAESDAGQKEHPDVGDLRIHSLLQAWQPTGEGWRIYENEEEYLIMFVASYPEDDDKKSYDDLANDILDSAWPVVRFFRAWFFRVNGVQYEVDDPEDPDYDDDDYDDDDAPEE